MLPMKKWLRYAGVFIVESLTTTDGVFNIIESPSGVVASGWCNAKTLIARFPADPSRSIRAGTTRAAHVVRDYYDEGAWQPVLDVPVAIEGSAFQRAVWAGLREIPAGSTMTYGQLATHLGRPAAARAIGGACGANRAALFIPCHRVVAGQGLGGFAWGTEVKQSLLAREAGITPHGGR